MSHRTKKQKEIKRLKKKEDFGTQEKNPQGSSSSLKKWKLQGEEAQRKQGEEAQIQSSRSNL